MTKLVELENAKKLALKNYQDAVVSLEKEPEKYAQIANDAWLSLKKANIELNNFVVLKKQKDLFNC